MLAQYLGTTLIRLCLATLLGLALGFERERHGHDAGLRTHGLVSLSSAMLTLSALELAESHAGSDPVHVVQGLAHAIGFIAGAGQYVLVLVGSAIALLVLATLLILERHMGRHPEKHRTDDHIGMPNRRGSAHPDHDG